MGKGQSAGIDPGQYAQPPGRGEWLWNRPVAAAQATLILGHGAGAPMDSEFMTQMAEMLAARRLDGKKRPPNPQAKLLETWRGVYARVRQQVAGPLAIGGKSMGGRMASLLADQLGAAALVCLGYPFYAAGKPDKPRIAHLAELHTPTLIVQGERDALGDRQTVTGYQLSTAITLHWLASGDHDLKPLKRSGFSHEQHMRGAADSVAGFLARQGRQPAS